MKNFSIFFFFLTVLCACNKNENENITDNDIIDNSLIIGEWVTVNSLQDIYADIEFSSNQRVKIMLVENCIGQNAVYKEDNGSWVTDESHLLSFTTFKNDIPQHKIIEISEDCMQLRNIKYNTIDTYYHVVDAIELNVGTSTSINYLQEHSDLKSAKITSSNADVATVSSDGVISAHQGGIAFVCINNGETIVYVKIICKSRIDVYSTELKLNIDEVLENHGSPDKKYNVKNTDLNMYEYLKTLNDRDISTTQYYFNTQTREIAKIVTKYQSPSILQADLAYLDKYYYLIKGSVNYYGKYENRYANSVLIYYEYGETGQVEGMHYNNMEYYTDNADLGDPTKEKEEKIELYLEPYLEWGESVSNVKTYMSNYLLTNDIESFGNYCSMLFQGNDFNNNLMAYQYDFVYLSLGLFRVRVMLSSASVTFEDIKSHLRANGYVYQYTNEEFPGGIYTKELANGHTTVGVFNMNDNLIQVQYVFTD